MDLGYEGCARFLSYQQRENISQGIPQAGNLLWGFVTWSLAGRIPAAQPLAAHFA